MRPILTPDETRELDRRSAERGIPVADLMERAGEAVTRSALRLLGGAYGRRAVVVCGKGNNGGDGLVAARLLHHRGVGVTAMLLADPSAVGGPAAENLGHLVRAGVRWCRFSAAGLRREVRRADLAVDAVFGTGFRGAPEGPFADAIRILDQGQPVLAVDIPSGVNGATGAVAGEAVRAVATITFGALKPGLVFHPGAELAGDVEVADIGFPPDLVRSDLCLMEATDAAALVPTRAQEAHKRSTGTVLLVAGSRSMTGAAILATRAAYRAGAGLVTLVLPESVAPVIQPALPEPVFLPVPETAGGAMAESAWSVIEERLKGVRAVGVGPGLSTDPSTMALVRRLVAESPVPVVLDADGLNAFAGRGADLARRASEAVLTPHEGEFARLAGPADDHLDRVARVRAAARAFDCTVLLKGPRTLVAEPSGTVSVNPTGGPVLATGGTGDVLTGTIASLLARGLTATDAARLGAYVHGSAGTIAGAAFGEGTTAADLPDLLPEAMRALVRAGGAYMNVTTEEGRS
jgi:NAD(P)H-hydrate epimerase